MNLSMILLCTLIIALQPSAGRGEENHAHHAVPVTKKQLALSPGLRDLLVQEMRAIEEGMTALITAIASGEKQDVAKIGRKMKDSFIMKRKLTKAQVEELGRSLPPYFKELDRSFHRSAGMLAHAAEMGNWEVVNFYFSRLTEGCIDCHSRYATRRFPAFVSGKEGGEHHH